MYTLMFDTLKLEICAGRKTFKYGEIKLQLCYPHGVELSFFYYQKACKNSPLTMTACKIGT